MLRHLLSPVQWNESQVQVFIMNILHFLFSAYCMSLFGIEMWYVKLENQKLYKRIPVTYQYHKAIKQMYGIKCWDDNHVACANMNLEIFKRLLAKRCYNFFSFRCYFWEQMFDGFKVLFQSRFLILSSY